MVAAQPLKISVLMPAYRTAAFIAESIDSVLAQTYPHWELIVIDDGSPDDVVDVVRPYLSDSRIICRSFPNGGLAMARNRGLELATGEIISLLDSDDLFEPNYLQIIADAFEQDPGLSFITSDSVMFGTPSREGRLFSEFESQKGDITLDRVLARQFNIFGAVAMRAADLREAGGFNTSLRAAEDFDLWTRLLLAGKRALYLPAPLIRYRRRDDSLSATTAKLLIAEMRVYLDRLAELPSESSSAAVCRRQIRACASAIERSNGEAAIRRGDLAAAADFFAESGAGRVLYWRVMIALMRHAPRFASTILACRDRRNAAHLSGVAR